MGGDLGKVHSVQVALGASIAACTGEWGLRGEHTDSIEQLPGQLPGTQLVPVIGCYGGGICGLGRAVEITHQNHILWQQVLQVRGKGCTFLGHI